MNPVFQKPFSLIGTLLGLAGVAAVSFVFARMLPANASTVGFFLLLVVLGTATGAGFRPAALVAITAALCFNYYFLPPVGLFTIADPENWVSLVTFLVTALVASHLSDRAQQQAAEARRRQQETEQLYSLSRSILLTEGTRPIGTQAAQSIAQIFDSPFVAIYDAKSRGSFRGGAEDDIDLDSRFATAVLQGSFEHDATLGMDIWPIALGGNPIGALAAKGIHISDGAVQSLLNLVAIALERVRTVEAANRAEVSRQNEELKSTLLDAIAHEFKTPLTSIKAAATGLRSVNPRMEVGEAELTAIIEEETDRLSTLVTEAVKMAQIDAGKIKPRLAACDAAGLLLKAVATFEGRGAERVEVQGKAEVAVNADADLIILALRQIIDNALKYANAGTTVQCTLQATQQQVQLRIADRGPGIAEQDRERIFDKFYRHASVRERLPGTGLGLHIAREIARIHRGDLWVETNPAGGAIFTLALKGTE